MFEIPKTIDDHRAKILERAETKPDYLAPLPLDDTLKAELKAAFEDANCDVYIIPEGFPAEGSKAIPCSSAKTLGDKFQSLQSKYLNWNYGVVRRDVRLAFDSEVHTKNLQVLDDELDVKIIRLALKGYQNKKGEQVTSDRPMPPASISITISHHKPVPTPAEIREQAKNHPVVKTLKKIEALPQAPGKIWGALSGKRRSNPNGAQSESQDVQTDSTSDSKGAASDATEQQEPETPVLSEREQAIQNIKLELQSSAAINLRYSDLQRYLESCSLSRDETTDVLVLTSNLQNYLRKPEQKVESKKRETGKKTVVEQKTTTPPPEYDPVEFKYVSTEYGDHIFQVTQNNKEVLIRVAARGDSSEQEVYIVEPPDGVLAPPLVDFFAFLGKMITEKRIDHAKLHSNSDYLLQKAVEQEREQRAQWHMGSIDSLLQSVISRLPMGLDLTFFEVRFGKGPTAERKLYAIKKPDNGQQDSKQYPAFSDQSQQVKRDINEYLEDVSGDENRNASFEAINVNVCEPLETQNIFELTVAGFPVDSKTVVDKPAVKGTFWKSEQPAVTHQEQVVGQHREPLDEDHVVTVHVFTPERTQEFVKKERAKAEARRQEQEKYKSTLRQMVQDFVNMDRTYQAILSDYRMCNNLRRFLRNTTHTNDDLELINILSTEVATSLKQGDFSGVIELTGSFFLNFRQKFPNINIQSASKNMMDASYVGKNALKPADIYAFWYSDTLQFLHDLFNLPRTGSTGSNGGFRQAAPLPFRPSHAVFEQPPSRGGQPEGNKSKKDKKEQKRQGFSGQPQQPYAPVVRPPGQLAQQPPVYVENTIFNPPMPSEVTQGYKEIVIAPPLSPGVEEEAEDETGTAEVKKVEQSAEEPLLNEAEQTQLIEVLRAALISNFGPLGEPQFRIQTNAALQTAIEIINQEYQNGNFQKIEIPSQLNDYKRELLEHLTDVLEPEISNVFTQLPQVAPLIVNLLVHPAVEYIAPRLYSR